MSVASCQVLIKQQRAPAAARVRLHIAAIASRVCDQQPLQGMMRLSWAEPSNQMCHEDMRLQAVCMHASWAASDDACT